MKTILVGMIISLSFPAWAQKVTVRRVKGNQAVVQINGGALKVGQTYDLGKKPADDDLELVGSNTGPRNKVIGFSTEISSRSSQVGSAKSNTTRYGGSVKYGWNKGAFEYGFNGLFWSSDSGAGATSEFGGGGFFDWNLSPNRPGNDMLFGFGADLTYAIINPPNGGQSSNRMDIYPAAFMKWFILGTPAAMRFDAGLSMIETSSGGSKVKSDGFLVRGGFSIYF